MFAYTTYSWKCLLLMSRADPGFLSGGGRGEGGLANCFFLPGGFQLLPQKYNTLNFHIQADVSHLYCICLTNITGSNHEEVSTNRDTLFLCVCFKDLLVLYHLIYFFQGGLSHSNGGSDLLLPPLEPPMQYSVLVLHCVQYLPPALMLIHTLLVESLLM